MIAKLERATSAEIRLPGAARSPDALGALARRLTHALEAREAELTACRRELAALELSREREDRLKRLGEAQAALAHQMRTPLTVAGLHVDQLLLEEPDERKQRRLHKVRASLGAVERQIRNCLVFVTGRLGEHARFDAADLVALLRDILAPLEDIHRIEWTLQNVDGVSLEGDRAVLAGAIVNVVENAVAAGGSRVAVSVTVRGRADRCEIVVSDDGPGMSSELLARVRVPFVTERSGGTGLGLAIAERVVAAHRGALQVQSVRGRGTNIRIVLPRAERDTT